MDLVSRAARMEPDNRTGTLLGDRTLANIAPLYMDYVERGAIVVVE